jgi:hypothetical protein
MREDRMAASPAEYGKSPPDDRRRKTRSAVGIGVILAGLAVAVFFAARGRERPLPEMPRAVFGDAEIGTALASLRSRAERVVPRGDEVRVVADMRALHVAEAAALRGAEPKDRGAALFDAFRKTAAALATADRERYLLVGEKLALELQAALGPLLEAARRDGMPAILSGGGAELRRVVDAGGTFVFKAAERGVIDPRGEIRGARLLPEVLFRKRWCGAVGMAGAERFGGVERRAELDFVAAFTTDVQQRLRAIDALAAMDRSYDGVVARALVLHGAGRDAEARRILEEAARTGRDDRPFALLRDALE